MNNIPVFRQQALVDAPAEATLTGNHAPEWRARSREAIAGGRMTVAVDLAQFDDHTASLLAEKMARCIGVEAVTIDSTPLARLTPTMIPA
jgi:hypothetical protein